MGATNSNRMLCTCLAEDFELSINSSNSDQSTTDSGRVMCDQDYIILKDDKKVNFLNTNSMEETDTQVGDSFVWTNKAKKFTIPAQFMQSHLAKQQRIVVKEDSLQLAGMGDLIVEKTEIRNSPNQCHFDENKLNLICERTEIFRFHARKAKKPVVNYSDAYSAGCLVKTPKGFLIFENASGELEIPGTRRRTGESTNETAMRAAKAEVGANNIKVDHLIKSYTPMFANGKHYLFMCSLTEPQDNFTPKDTFEAKKVLLYNRESKPELESKNWSYPTDKKILGSLEL